MKISWTSKKLLMNEINENAANPRKLSREAGNQLKRSLEKFGLCEPVVVNTDGMIIGGHQRYRLLQQMNQYEIDCFVPDRLLTFEEVQELTIRLNKNTGDWDYDILADVYDLNSLLDWGFSEKELQIDVNAIADATNSEKKEDVYDLRGLSLPLLKHLLSAFYNSEFRNEFQPHIFKNGKKIELKGDEQ